MQRCYKPFLYIALSNDAFLNNLTHTTEEGEEI